MSGAVDDIPAIAGKLSEAQRKWIPSFSDEQTAWFPAGCSRRTVERLIKDGFLQKIMPAGLGMVRFRLTPLGLAVRAYLEGQSK